jgi:hypothetical protein
LLVLGGEQPSWQLVRQITQLAPRLRVMNHYGPTETTVGVIAGMIDPRDAGRLSRPALGNPLPGIDAQVLDDELRPTADWIPGQIYVAGPTVGRGYYAAPAATAASFLPNPTGPGRLYATGDRARRLGDGRIEYLGRADRQIKINGFRADPAEVEAALGRLDGVSRAFVVPREHEKRGIRLAAYVLPSDPARWDPPAWRAALARELPTHLLPTSITRLTTVPLKDNGKLDVGQLPPEVPVVSPGAMSATESMIAAIWCEVLGLAAVGPEDRLFDVGGHSLSLMQIRRQLLEKLSVDLTLPQLFSHPTVRAMAALAEGCQRQDNFRTAHLRAERQRAALLSSLHPGKGDPHP